MKVISILELQSARATQRFCKLRAAGGKREPFLAAMTAAQTTLQTGMVLFLQREIVNVDDPETLGEAVLDGLIRTRREWFSAASAGHQVSEEFATNSGKGTYEAALADQSARRWYDAAFEAARAGQIAAHWRQRIEQPQSDQISCAA